MMGLRKTQENGIKDKINEARKKSRKERKNKEDIEKKRMNRKD